MNAVAGVFGAARNAPELDARHALARMFDRMHVRSNGTRVVLSGPAAFIGAAGSAPAAHEEPGVGIVAGDIRLDNRRELRAALDLPADVTDARIALEAYLRWGDAFARSFAGDFALLIVDHRLRRAFAVRDHLGIRPLFYRVSASGVCVATELAALVEPGDAADEGFLAEALADDRVDLEATPYLAIKRLPAAHALVIDTSGERASPPTAVRYWEPPSEPLVGTLAEHAERVRAAFDEAVAARCEGLPRVGVHLSGGLDSSSVFGAVAANRFSEPVVASLALPWPEADERDWIAAAAARWGVATHYVTPQLSPAAHDAGAVARHRDLPDFPTGGPLMSALQDRFRAEGIGVVLTGLGGDQWWTGDATHLSDLIRGGRVADVLAWRRAGAAMGQLQWDRAMLIGSGLIPLVPPALRRAFRRIRPWKPPSWMDAGFAARVSLVERLRRRPATAHAPSEAWRRMRWRLGSGEEAASKERLHRASVHAGIELRHPMYDRRLVELAFRIPDAARVRDGRSRVVFREAMADRLAAETYARAGKADPSRVLLAAARDPALERHLALPRLSERGWIDRAVASDMVRRVVRDDDVEMTRSFWALIGVEVWLSEVFGGE